MFKSISIDGPAGSGKSDVAEIISKKLGFLHIDTGALYRSVAFYFSQKLIDFSNETLVCKELSNIKIDIKFDDLSQKVILNGVDISGELRKSEVSKIASKISPYKCVREFLLPIQREFSKNHNVVMEGRDISTVVLPGANVKIFLTASVEERAKRRFKQLESRKIKCDYNQILFSIKERDCDDTNRKYSPLKVSDDAIFLDSTGKTIEEVVDFLMYKIRKVIY